MKTVNDNINEIIINKSKFITFTFHLDKIEDVKEKLEFVKSKCKDATHYCYAYIINNQEKCSDDGEPSSTAGAPILNVLQKENVNNVLCVVVRYFGGIKLGAGGLVRAYSKSCKDCLNIIELKKGYLLSIAFDYNNINRVQFLLKESVIVNKVFDIKNYFTVKISLDEYNKIYPSLKQISDIKILEEIYI